MSARRRFFWAQAVLLVAVVTPLALAQGQWIHWVLAVAGAGAGFWGMAVRRKPWLGPRGGYAAMAVALVVLLIEITLLGAIPVVALSHFLILVCVVKLLQEQTLRDQAQVFVICLLLLVVAAIVSGDLVFPFVLVIYLIVGVPALMRLHMAVEQSRVAHHNEAAEGHGPGPAAARAPARAVTGEALLLDLVAITVGAALFMLSPRVGPGMIGRFEDRVYADTVTGFSTALGFERIGPIRSSERQVMTVQLEDEFGRTLGPEVGEVYYRGMAFNQYRRPMSRGGYWEWRVAGPWEDTPYDVLCKADEEGGGTVRLIPSVESAREPSLLIQRYWLAPAGHRFLYACYPALEIRSRQFGEVRKRIRDQTLQLLTPRSGIVRYEAVSATQLSGRVLRELASEREPDAQPAVWLPNPPLPREAEIRRLIATIDARAGTAGPLDDPAERQRFVEAVMGFLRSGDFVYTLAPTSVQHGRGPIGDFLLHERRGHCEYFASALVLMCQYRGVPARVVTGYLGGEYNSVGGYFVVRQRDAHTWAEVFIPGRDWVRYDPTPAAGQIRGRPQQWWMGVSKYVDFLRFQWNNQVVGYDANLRQALFARFAGWLRRPVGHRETWAGTILAFIGEMVFWRSELSLQDRLLYYAFTGMVLALVMLLAYVAVYVARWLISTAWRVWLSPPMYSVPREAEFYTRFRQRAESLGQARPGHQTPAEYADGLARRFSAFQEAPDLVRAYYDVVFGRRAIPVDRRARIESFLRSLRGVSPSQLRGQTPTGQ